MAHLVLLTGPAGAGKSATAAVWAESQVEPAAHLCVDAVRHFVKSGYASPKQDYNAEAHRQFELARGHCALMAARYVDAGISCIVDDLILPNTCSVVDHDSWVTALGGRNHTVVVLLPALDVVLRRNAERADREPIPENMARAIYELMSPWEHANGVAMIDTSSMSPQEAALSVGAVLEPRRLSSSSVE